MARQSGGDSTLLLLTRWEIYFPAITVANAVEKGSGSDDDGILKLHIFDGGTSSWFAERYDFDLLLYDLTSSKVKVLSLSPAMSDETKLINGVWQGEKNGSSVSVIFRHDGTVTVSSLFDHNRRTVSSGIYTADSGSIYVVLADGEPWVIPYSLSENNTELTIYDISNFTLNKEETFFVWIDLELLGTWWGIRDSANEFVQFTFLPGGFLILDSDNMMSQDFYRIAVHEGKIYSGITYVDFIRHTRDWL